MDIQLTRETLRFERLVRTSETQITIEGEATLPGSMRDAVTVLSVQAQAHVTGTQAGAGEAGLRGRVCFQVLYTQGDLTRVRSLETACDFEHRLPMEGVTPGQRLCVAVGVLEATGAAGSGRMALRALLGVRVDAFELVEKQWVRDLALGKPDADAPADVLQTRQQTLSFCRDEVLGEGRAVVREEFDLPAKLEAGDALQATGVATVGELSGGAGRVTVSGVMEVRVLHRPLEAGKPMAVTAHELPFEVSVDAALGEGAQPYAQAEVLDVMADCVNADKRQTLRVEAEVRVRLSQCVRQEATLLADAYTLSGAQIEPVSETLDVHTGALYADVRESARIQATLPQDAPPIDKVLATMIQPMVTAVSPAGRRLDAEGIMGVTLLYLPVDSDIPYAAHLREPFTMTFPVEAAQGVSAMAYPIEASVGPTTSDRAEVRCVVGLRVAQHDVRAVTGVAEVEQRPPVRQERGFVLVWPERGESRWQTARRLRVAESSLRPAGKGALLAFRK